LAVGRVRWVSNLVAAALGALLAGAAAAQGQHEAELERLRAQIGQRDAVILELLQRVEALEQRFADQVGAAAARPVDAASSSRAAVPPPARSALLAQAPAPAAPAQPPGAATEPGAFEVDGEAAERALERTLVQTGALLLEPGRAEIATRFTFRRDDHFAALAFIRDSELTVAMVERRRQTSEAGFELRFGLPFESQLEVGMPYRHVSETDIVRVGFQPDSGAKRSGTGWGDMRFSLAKTLLREEGWRPDLVGRITWHAPVGESESGGVPLGGGFHAIEGQLSAARRLDPLVFAASASAVSFRRREGVEPGNQYGFALGAFLAASPETSLRLVLHQVHSSETRIDGRQRPGSERIAPTLTTGASVIIWRQLLLDVAGDIGITDDAPDYGLRLGLTHRFNAPWR
jgi:hypothetical protein